MKTPNPSDEQTDLDRVLEKINEIAKESADGDYIYRGEPEHYKQVSSSLYREFPEVDRIPSNITRARETILEEVKAYISKTDDIDETDDIGILTELQHFGGKTNLIDFTEDYLIALFFACDGSHEEDGRVILLKRQSRAYKVKIPRRTINRVESQKSVFVESPDGFVTPDLKVTVPADLKFPILTYLRKYHRISIETIYNDLHGFIKRSAYTEFLKGLNFLRKVSEAQTRKEKQEHCGNAIKHFTEAIKLKSDYEAAYTNRGIAYADKGDFVAAFGDFNKAIDLNPEYADAYVNRGNAYADKGDFAAAFGDYSKAIDLNPADATAYYNRGVAHGEKGDFVAALGDFNKAIDLNLADATAYTNRGVAYAGKGDIAAALGDFNKAIDLNPADATAYYNRGVAHGEKGDFAAALGDYSKVIDLNPEYADAYVNRGIAYADKGDFASALGDFNKAIDLNPEYADAYYNRFLVWLHLKEWEKAQVDLMTAKNKGGDIIALFHSKYESVEDFETENGVTLPEDIATLLRGNRT